MEENKDAGIALEPAEETAILEAATRNDSPLIYPYLMTLAWTGMRDAEGRLLKWEQVDFEAGHVVVGKSKTEKGARRVIPLSGPLRAALEQHLAQCARWFGPVQPHWFLFPFSNRRKPIDPERPITSFKTAWRTVRKQAGLKCRLHDLRHSFCTKLGVSGCPRKHHA